jgi:prevent-host-death family protein
MAKEKLMTFVQARSKLSEIVDRVAEHGDTYVLSKRQKPRAVIIGVDRYRTLHLKVFENVEGNGSSTLKVSLQRLATSTKQYASCASHGSKRS